MTASVCSPAMTRSTTVSWTPRKWSKPKTRFRSSCGSVISLLPCDRAPRVDAPALPSLGRLRNLVGKLFGDLALPQIGIEAALVEQLVMSAALGDCALVEHDDLVGVDNGREAV